MKYKYQMNFCKFLNLYILKQTSLLPMEFEYQMTFIMNIVLWKLHSYRGCLIYQILIDTIFYWYWNFAKSLYRYIVIVIDIFKNGHININIFKKCWHIDNLIDIANTPTQLWWRSNNQKNNWLTSSISSRTFSSKDWAPRYLEYHEIHYWIYEDLLCCLAR